MQIKKLRPRDVKELAQDCTADEWQPGSNLDFFSPDHAVIPLCRAASYTLIQKRAISSPPVI